jgi:photosystem II stability/assembly factor-like uncharacterized protein
MKFFSRIALCCFLLTAGLSNAQNQTDATNSPLDGLELRSIGPGFMSGRIADIEIHPENENIWYVAVGSGGVWKTENAGTTWTPVFDKQNVYSIGTITIDPNNPDTVWVGTGEDVGGRHVSFGDGVYRSDDGGKTWKNMGLTKSEHISRILVHPYDSDVIWVTAQGPLWSKGGERGLYKSTDGGKTWTKTLGDELWTGVTDLVMDPSNPNRLYAATWQRHRTVAAYMGGGPGTALYRSDDGGDSWTKLETGLPNDQWMGKIGLAVSYHNPDVVYAAIELNRRTGGLYRSADGGNSWTKMSETVSGGTGPHYYQELYASPHHEGMLYLMDNNLQISEDGGKTFYRMNEKNKHGDNHAIAFKKYDANYLIVGSDGGLYESFDLTKTWKFVENLPVTQYYKVAVDDAQPFYNIYGGTQDNSTQGGPSRTDNVHGIQNSDWRVILDWDGHQPATEPGNPNIVYGERQEGTLSRIDMATGEVVDIQPQPGENEGFERFNWDSPILVSPHSPTTIFFASHKVWKSTNRGDSWTAISGDLTRDQERLTLPIMGKKQSWDAPWDVYAMSTYNTITSLAESPLQQGLIYAGTDDGLIQVTENGGQTWRKIEVGSLPGVPSTAFVNDIKADLFDAGTVYVALDNHKYGDFTPYILKSTDRGNSWRSIRTNIPDRHLVWRVVQDHISPNLLFAGTEFGLFVTVDGGKQWHELNGNVPTISFRDLALQRRENDLVAASFGRGFFILDDYAVLREWSDKVKEKEAHLFAVRDTWWYIPRPHLSFEPGKGSQGDAHFVAPNPDFGATFTYYLKDAVKSGSEIRKEKEKAMAGKDISFAGWKELEAQKLESEAQLIFAISDASGKMIRKLYTPANKAGVHRISWDLRYPASEPIQLEQTEQNDGEQKGLMAPPGNYSVSMFLLKDGQTRPFGGPVNFEVKRLYKGSIEGRPVDKTSDFWREFETVSAEASAFEYELEHALKHANALELALKRSSLAPGAMDKELAVLLDDLNSLKSSYAGNQAKAEIGEKGKPTIGQRMFAVYRGIEHSAYGPTPSHLEQLEIVKRQLNGLKAGLKVSSGKLDGLAKNIQSAGGPVIKN